MENYMQIIAKIKLAPGNAGWYDHLTNTHLTIANPYAEIKSGMKLDAIRKGIAFGTIQLIEGSVSEPEVVEIVEEQQAAREVIEQAAERAIQEAQAEPEIDETAPAKAAKKAAKKKAK